MNTDKCNELKLLLDDAKVVFFDIFDNLLIRKIAEWDDFFNIIGKKNGVYDYKLIRKSIQNSIYDVLYADSFSFDEMYDSTFESFNSEVEYGVIRDCELNFLEHILVVNTEMQEIFEYAKKQNKKIFLISDFICDKDSLKKIVHNKGFSGYVDIFFTNDKRDYENIADRHGIPLEELLYIGENKDAFNPNKVSTFIYSINSTVGEMPDIDEYEFNRGIYNILYNEDNSFWYNLGVRVGGPLYLSLYFKLKDKMNGRKVFFHSQDGSVLYEFLKNKKDCKADLIDISDRTLLLAGITDLDDESNRVIYEYVRGNTIQDFAACLDIADLIVNGSNDTNLNCVINDDNADKLKTFLHDNKDVILQKAKHERENLYKYLNVKGYFEEDNCVHFSCSWNGLTQLLFDRFHEAICYNENTEFYYYGIVNSEDSRSNLHGRNYSAFLFDFYRNYYFHNLISDGGGIFNLFFGTGQTVVSYNSNGEPVFCGQKESIYEDVRKGINDYLGEAIDFTLTNDIEVMPELSVNNIQRLIYNPIDLEIEEIGQIGVPTINPSEIKKIALKNATINLLENKDDEPIYHLEGEDAIREYHRWLRNQEKCVEDIVDLTYNPLFSFVIPVYNTVSEQLRECIDSVLSQNYTNYELILVDDHSSWENVVPVLKEYEGNDKVKVIYRKENGHISMATNDAINVSRGDYIVFMDCDDVIEKNAIYEFAKLLNEHPEYDFIYSDEDKITEDGKIRHMPFFKPDWSPDLFHCMMYTNHLATYRASIIKEIGGLRTAYNGSQDYDMTLRFMEKSNNNRVGHVSKILYHWRERKESAAFSIGAKNYAATAAKNAKLDYLRRNNIKGKVECIPGISQYRIVYDVIGNPLVSIIIPSKDHPEVLKQCVDSILRRTTYSNYEIIVVDNGSNRINQKIVNDYLTNKRAKYIYDNYEFNFSKMCNIGRYNAQGEYLLFLNDDIEIIQDDWLERMLGQAQQKHVGAVGAKLLYPKTTLIQHCGVSNMYDGPSHDFLACKDDFPLYFSLNWLDSDRIAVTAANLMVSKVDFDSVGGFEEKLPVAYNDVSFCFSLAEKGLYNVVRNDVVAYHHESLSRGNDLIDKEKRLRLSKELERLYNRFYTLNRKDPFLNKNIYHLTSSLLLLNNNDDVFLCDKKIKQIDGILNIDLIETGTSVHIEGWSDIGIHTSGIKERYIIFEDPYNNYYLAETMPVKRDDVMEALGGDEKYQYLGFECKFPLDRIAIDVVPYKIGVCYASNNNYIVVWGRDTDIVSVDSPYIISTGEKVYTEHSIDNKELVYWSLDECIERDDMYIIRGYAIVDKKEHYNYNKTIVLKGINNTYEFQTFYDSRPDVALVLSDKNFVVNCGFVCRIYKEELEEDNYKINIRFVNKYNDLDEFIVDMSMQLHHILVKE